MAYTMLMITQPFSNHKLLLMVEATGVTMKQKAIGSIFKFANNKHFISTKGHL